MICLIFQFNFDLNIFISTSFFEKIYYLCHYLRGIRDDFVHQLEDSPAYVIVRCRGLDF